jgi:DMSO/TMAO reductase YedYZ molybdopterin-dependent catalytic subunit
MIASPRSGFLAGLGAGALAAVIMLVLRLALNSPSLAELLADRITFFVPLPLFEMTLQLLGAAAKRLFFGAVVVGMILMGGLLGALAGRRHLGPRDGLIWLVTLWLATAALLLPALGAGPFGALTPQGPVGASLALAGIVAVYGGVLYGLAQLLQAAPAASPANARRRRLVRLAGLSGLAVVAGGVGVWQLVESLGRRAGSAVYTALAQGAAKLSPEITPVGQFYTVSKNFFADPVVDAPTWRLEIGGKVERPYSLTYDELRALPAVEDYRTLLCISNEVGGDLIGNAQWRGVRLPDLLARAGPAPGAYKVIFTCADDYTESIRFDKAMQPETFLAYEMNGEPLIPKHGYPARLLVPGLYGIKNVKWLRKIEVSERDYRGFWQQRGWTEEGIIKTVSRIDTVASYTSVGTEPLLLGGIAFAGDRGIQRVEFSVDNGQTWQEAQIKPPLGPYTWVLWIAEWTPPGPGQYMVKARATDKTGGPPARRRQRSPHRVPALAQQLAWMPHPAGGQRSVGRGLVPRRPPGAGDTGRQATTSPCPTSPVPGGA